MSDTELSQDIAAAFDAAEAPEPVASPEPVPSASADDPGATPPTEVDGEAEGRARDEKGRFAKAAAEKAAAAAAPAETPKAADSQSAKPDTAVKVTPDPVAQPALKAPQSWKPASREEWAKTPAAVQAEVDRREREFQQTLRESSEARQTAQKFKDTIAPFEQMVRAEGGEPLQAIQGLFQTAYALRTAPPQAKAQMIARMVQTFLPGREGLELLDAALTPGAQPQQQAYQAQQPYRDPRLDQVLARLEAQDRAAQQTVAQRAEQMLADVQGEEFFEDVRADMADVLEMAAKRGMDMSPRDAYNRAVRLHPEVSKVLEQREAAKRAATPSGATQRREAASSVRSSPASGPGNTKERSLREDLEAALDAR